MWIIASSHVYWVLMIWRKWKVIAIFRIPIKGLEFDSFSIIWLVTINMNKLFLILLATLACSAQAQDLPNIIFLLLEGTSMNYVNGPALTGIRQRILDTDNGVNFEHMFATSPICCPSRTTIYSGMYMHNHGTTNNSISGNCQYNAPYEAWIEKSYAYHLQNDANYYTCQGLLINYSTNYCKHLR